MQDLFRITIMEGIPLRAGISSVTPGPQKLASLPKGVTASEREDGSSCGGRAGVWAGVLGLKARGCLQE